jgi:hypothetical protein
MGRSQTVTIFLLIFFLIFSSAGCVNQESHCVGQTVSDGPLEFTLHDVQFPAIGIKHLTSPTKGNRYLVANVTVTNSGKSDYSFFNSLYNVLITDETGAAYPIDQFRSGYIETGWHDGTLYPGESRTGLMIYEVPVTSRKFELNLFYPSKSSHVAS